MTRHLVRYQNAGHLHFVTFSCYDRRPYLGSEESRRLFEAALETMRTRYRFWVLAYVVMPEHVHLLVSEPKVAMLSKVIQALKLSVALKRKERPFWQPRYYDFNVISEKKRIEKLRYIHRNPVKRGLVERPEEWVSSSFRHYQSSEIGIVGVGVDI